MKLGVRMPALARSIVLHLPEAFLLRDVFRQTE